MKKVSIAALMLTAMTSGLVSCTKSPAKGNGASVQKSTPRSVTAAVTQAATVPDKVVVYYFHGTRRCPTCRRIQETIEQTVQERFAAKTASAALEFQEINYEEPENKHFIKDFNLSFSTMIVTANKGQTMLKWDNFNKVWDYAHDKPALTEYTEKSIREYLAMLKGK